MNGRFSPSLNKPQTSETRLVATVIHYAPSNLDLCSYLEGPAKDGRSEGGARASRGGGGKGEGGIFFG